MQGKTNINNSINPQKEPTSFDLAIQQWLDLMISTINYQQYQQKGKNHDNLSDK